MTTLTIRDVTPTDYLALCAIRNLSLAEPITPELLGHRDHNSPAGTIRLRPAACSGDELIGWAQAIHWPGLLEGLFVISLDIAPEHRRQGVGRRLLAEVERLAREHGATKFKGAYRDDMPASKAFLENAGYSFAQHLFDAVVQLEGFSTDLYSARQAEIEAEGIRFVRYSEWGDTPDHRRKLFEIHNLCDADTPGIEEWGLATYEDWEEDFLGGRSDLDAMFVAFSGDEIIGMSAVAPVSDEGYGTHFTGVLPAWRGRGTGLVLKGLCVRQAQVAGAKWVRTQNDTRNAGMLAVNRRLGFTPEFGWIYMEKEVGSTGS